MITKYLLFLVILLVVGTLALAQTADTVSKLEIVREFAATAPFRVRVELSYISPLAGRTVDRAKLSAAAHLHVTINGVLWQKPLQELAEILKHAKATDVEEPLMWASEVKIVDVQDGKTLLIVQMPSSLDLAIVNDRMLEGTNALKQWHLNYVFPIVQKVNHGARIKAY